MAMVKSAAAGASAMGASSMTRGLEVDLAHREGVAARLVGIGSILIVCAVLACVAWYLLNQYGNSDVQQALVHLDVPREVTAAIPSSAGAGPVHSTVNKEFESIVSIVQSWSDGYLVKALALAMFLMGTGMGIVKQSVVPPMMGLVWALMLTTVPSVLMGMVGPLGQGARASSVLVTEVFERDHDIANLRKALVGADLPDSAKSYLLAQAMVIAGGNVATGAGSEFYGLVARTLEKGQPSIDLSGASASVRAQLERMAFGRTVSASARDFEQTHTLAKRVAEHTVVWGAGIGLDAGLGALLVAMGLSVAGSVKRVRRVMESPNADLSSHEVPDFTADGSRHIEHMVSMLEKGRS